MLIFQVWRLSYYFFFFLKKKKSSQVWRPMVVAATALAAKTVWQSSHHKICLAVSWWPTDLFGDPAVATTKFAKQIP